MSEERASSGSGRRHFQAVVVITVIVMVLGILVVAAPERMGVPQTPTPALATPGTGTPPP